MGQGLPISDSEQTYLNYVAFSHVSDDLRKEERLS